MATRTLYRLSPNIIANDRNIIQAVAALPDYAPVNPRYSLAVVQQLEAALVAAQQAEDRAVRAVAIARHEVLAASWALHDAVGGVKLSIEAQFGNDSIALHAIGRKRRSEHKYAVRRSKKSE